MEVQRTNSFLILSYLFGALIIILLAIPYLKADIHTQAARALQIDPNKICRVTDQSNAPEIKIISYTKYKGELELYCLYDDPNKNQFIKANLNRANEFETVFVENMNQDSRMYWPIYKKDSI
jgi:hypothetical protein